MLVNNLETNELVEKFFGCAGDVHELNGVEESCSLGYYTELGRFIIKQIKGRLVLLLPYLYLIGILWRRLFIC